MKTPAILRISKWSETFETAESRSKITAMQWVALPSGCDSDGFLTLSGCGPDGVQAMGVFMALLQAYAGKFKKRDRDGAFIKSDGSPMSLANIATLARLSPDIVSKAVDLLASPAVGWLEWVPPIKDDEPTGKAENPNPDAIRTPSGRHPDDIPTTVQDSTVQDRTVQDPLPPLPPKGDGEREGLEPDFFNDAVRIVAIYTKASGKPTTHLAHGAVVSILARRRETIESLTAKTQACAAVIASLPGKEKRLQKSAEAFFEEGYYLSDPNSFATGRTPNGDTVASGDELMIFKP